MADFRNLEVWQKSHVLTLATFKVCEEMSGSVATVLRQQLIKSVLSIQSNVAEGSAKQSDREFARFVRIAMGSATETENHLLVARDHGLAGHEEAESLIKKVKSIRGMLTRLAETLSAAASRSP
jgi:four helix bundle protein